MLLMQDQYCSMPATTYSISKDRFSCVEPLFSEFKLIDKMKESINLVDPVIHKAILSNILITGGHSLTKNFAARMRKELAQNPLSDSFPFKGEHVIQQAGDNAIFSSWKGAGMLASSPGFEKQMITKEEYDDYGPNIVHFCCT